MKLIRFGEFEQEKPGILIGNSYYDVSSCTDDYNEQFFANGGLDRLRTLVNSQRLRLPRLDASTRIGSPVARPSKIICIGLNYADHARETGAAIPVEPIVFFKSTTALSGPFDPVMLPKGATKTDWEVELAVVIGKKASCIEETGAENYIAGYCLHNDLSERAFQLERNGQWVKGKSCDTFAPLGPWLVTKDEIKDADKLRLWLKVNGKIMQEGVTSDLIFKIPYLIAYVSRFMTLLPGDIISTGTPAGVAMGRKPAPYLKEGDVIELGIDGLGTSKQTVIGYEKN